jgi:hypothetical protein
MTLILLLYKNYHLLEHNPMQSSKNSGVTHAILLQGRRLLHLYAGGSFFL